MRQWNNKKRGRAEFRTFLDPKDQQDHKPSLLGELLGILNFTLGENGGQGQNRTADTGIFRFNYEFEN